MRMHVLYRTVALHALAGATFILEQLFIDSHSVLVSLEVLTAESREVHTNVLDVVWMELGES